LRLHAAAEVQQRIEGAEPYPLAGVQLVRVGTLASHRRRPAPPTMTTGTGASDAVFQFPGEGRIIVVTGYPNQGKSTWATFVMMHVAKKHGRRFAVFSPEMLPWEEYAARCAEIHTAQSYRGSAALPAMSDDDLAMAEEFLEKHIVMLVPDSEDEAPTLDWFLGRVRELVTRHGVTDALLDPWNELSFDRKGESETDHIGRALQRLRAFGMRHGVNFWIVAHPAKPPPLRPGEKIDPPSLLSISGSQHWANKADLGFSVHEGTIHCVKSRFRRWGRRGTKVQLDFDETTGRFATATAKLPPPPQQVEGPPEPPPRQESMSND
jgi:twinkle protein